ncbi:hypothetical protein HDV00_000298 [Rhizophlyctis rosea]|nr:hypothetical protein HDV00_000298 [Rhizophlyctis rosea]
MLPQKSMKGLPTITLRTSQTRPLSSSFGLRGISRSLLLGILTFVALISLIFVLDSSTRIGLFSPSVTPLPANLSPAHTPTFKVTNKYTIVVASYEKRLSSLKHFLTQYAGPTSGACKSLESVVVIWISKIPPPEEILDFVKADGNLTKRVRFVWREGMDLNDRFKVDGVANVDSMEDGTKGTESVLSLDDDVRIDCETVEFGFLVRALPFHTSLTPSHPLRTLTKTHQSFPDRLTGWVPRAAIPQPTKNNTLSYSYIYKRSRYNLMLTGATFYHINHARQYWHPSNAPHRQFVSEHWNCEDILFNYVVASTAPWPGARSPMFANGVFITEKQNGLSGKKGHIVTRSECLNLFRGSFGDVLSENIGVGQVGPILIDPK